jgi:hypothetical protein
MNIQEPSTKISSTMRESNKHKKERIKGQQPPFEVRM